MFPTTPIDAVAVSRRQASWPRALVVIRHFVMETPSPRQLAVSTNLQVHRYIGTSDVPLCPCCSPSLQGRDTDKEPFLANIAKSYWSAWRRRLCVGARLGKRLRPGLSDQRGRNVKRKQKRTRPVPSGCKLHGALSSWLRAYFAQKNAGAGVHQHPQESV